MRLGGISVRVGAVAVALALASVGSAQAAPIVTVQHGVTYSLQATTAVVGPGSDNIASPCPGDIYPLSGGFFNGGGHNEVFMTANLPVDSAVLDPAFDGWSASWRGSPASAYALQTLAVCDEKEPSYRQRVISVKSHTRKSVTVRCTRRQHVYGGGIGSPILVPGAILASSYPIDSRKDRDHKPDDGWRLSADNENPSGKLTLTAIAICGKAKPAYVSKQSKIFTVGHGTQDADCPTGKPAVVGGGQKMSGGYGDTILSISFAPMPDYDSWVATADRFSAKTETIRAFAVCVGALG